MTLLCRSLFSTYEFLTLIVLMTLKTASAIVSIDARLDKQIFVSIRKPITCSVVYSWYDVVNCSWTFEAILACQYFDSAWVRANLAVMPDRHKIAACLKIRMIATWNVTCVIRRIKGKYPASNDRCCCQQECANKYIVSSKIKSSK